MYIYIYRFRSYSDNKYEYAVRQYDERYFWQDFKTL